MANILPQLRRKLGVKQNDLARALAVSPSYLCKIEKGVIDPSPAVMQRCSEFFGMAVGALFPPARKTPVLSPGDPAAVHPLWEARRRRGLKQYELARQLDCSPSYLSKVEKGLVEPRSEFRKLCARILKIKEKELFP